MPRIDASPRAPLQQPIIDVKPIVDQRLPEGLGRLPFFHDAFEKIERHAVRVATVRAGKAGELVDRAFEQILHRAPTSPDEIAEVKKTAEEMAARGQPMAEITRYVSDAFEALPEAQELKARELRKLDAATPVDAEYQKMLGRAPNEEELAKGTQWVKQLIDEGKTGDEVTASLDYVLALTPEWQDAHRPKMSTDRDAIYLQQPNGWSCGPTSLAMAMGAAGISTTIDDTIKLLGARSGVGTPGSAALIADKAKELGAQAEYNPSRETADARAALERGHGIVVNGDIGGGGHFIYLAGLDENGQYIVCDPYRPQITRWNDSDLYAFTHHGSNPPGFAEIWK